MAAATDLTPEMLEQLEAIAKAATPGPWRVEVGNFNRRGTALTNAPPSLHWADPGYTPIACSHLFSDRHAEDWTHIAAASPDVVLALVAAAKERDQLRAEVERLRAAKPLLVHIDRDGESLCGRELHHGAVPLTAERSEVTCVGCWILRDEEAVQAAAEVARLQGVIEGMAKSGDQQTTDDLEPFCDGCGQEIDPTTCGCGSEMPCYEHGVPMGCRCLRADHGDGDIAKGLRARLREERAVRRRLSPPISEEAEQLADGLVAESRKGGRRIADDRLTRLAEAVRDLEESFGNGCGNRPCYFHNARSPGGQHTNGRCRCLDALENCDEPARGRIRAREIVRLLNAAREMVGKS